MKPFGVVVWISKASIDYQKSIERVVDLHAQLKKPTNLTAPLQIQSASLTFYNLHRLSL